MSQFVFSTTRSIVCEIGSAKRLGQLLVQHQLAGPAPGVGAGGARRTVLAVTDKGITSRGLELGAFESLAELGMDVVMYDDVEPNPPERCVRDATALAREVGADCVVGFGGGSSLDVAKLVAFLAHPDAKQDLSHIYGVDACLGRRLPLVQVPTTAGTGSEVTPISIVTTGDKEKKGVVSQVLLPDLAVLDAELTLSVPRDVTAATGVDAMVHAIEALTSRPKKNALSDLFAGEALRLLGANVREVCASPGNLVARSDMLLGSCYAGAAFANAPVAAVHALAYPISSHFGVPHGLANALMLPHVLRFNEADPAAAKVYVDARGAAFPGSDAPLADCFEALAKDIGMQDSLGAVGIAAGDVELLAAEAMKQTRLLPNNPREVTIQDARDMFNAAL